MKKKRWGIKLISIILIIFILLQAIQNVGKFYNKYFQNNNIKALPEDTPQPIAANFVTYKDWDAYSSLDDKYSYSTLFWIPGVSQIINIDEPAALMYPSSNKYYGYDGGSFSFRITNCAIDEDGSMCDVIVTCNNIEAWETTAGWNLAEEEIGREQYQNKRICCYVTVDNDGIMKYLDKVVPGRENPYDSTLCFSSFQHDLL